MAKVIWFGKTVPTVVLQGRGRRTAGAWVVADDSGGPTNAAYPRQWVGPGATAYLPHDDPLVIGGLIKDMIRFSDSDLWLLFEWGLCHWDGSAWTDVGIDPSYTASFVALAATSSSDVYAIALGGTDHQIDYFYWDGSTATGPFTVTYASAVSNVLRTASLVSGGAVRVGGTAIVTLSGTVEYTPGSLGTYISRLWGRTSTIGWAVLRVPDGSSNSVVYGSGGSWSTGIAQPAYSGSEAPFHYGIHGTSDSDVWICGGLENSGVFSYLVEHYDGSTWTRHTVGTTDTAIRELFDIHAESSTDVWATGYRTVGSTSLIVAWHWDGSAWTERSPTT